MNPVFDASSRSEDSGHKIYVIAGLISWQPFSSKRIRIGPRRDYFSFPPTLPGTLPLTERVPSSCFRESLFGAISLANPFWVDVHPT